MGCLPMTCRSASYTIYERTLSSQVNDIEHIELQSLPRYGVVKVFFQPGVNINAALAETTAASQTVLKFLPQGMTPPFVLTFNASSVPVIQLALSSKSLVEAQIYDYGQNFIRPQLASIPGSAIPSPYGGKVLQVQVDIDQDKLEAYGLSTKDVVDAIGRQNIVTPVGTEKVGDFEYVVNLNGSPERLDNLNNLPIRVVNGATVFVHDVAYAHFGAPPQINMVRVDGANAVLMTILKNGSASTLDVINGVKALLPKIRETLPRSLKLDTTNDQSSFVFAAVNVGHLRGRRRGGVDRLDDPDLSRQLALDSDHHDLHSAGDPGLRRSAVGHRRNDQRHDARRPRARGRHSRRRRDGDDREHQLPSRAGQGHRNRRSWTARDRSSSLRPFRFFASCIVFVPMFKLGGVAGYLFRPMAEAVVVRSDRILRAVAHSG